MTPQEHYRRAEELLTAVREDQETVNERGRANPDALEQRVVDDRRAAWALAIAQAEVHARLAAIPQTVELTYSVTP